MQYNTLLVESASKFESIRLVLCDNSLLLWTNSLMALRVRSLSSELPIFSVSFWKFWTEKSNEIWRLLTDKGKKWASATPKSSESAILWFSPGKQKKREFSLLIPIKDLNVFRAFIFHFHSYHAGSTVVYSWQSSEWSHPFHSFQDPWRQ